MKTLFKKDNIYSIVLGNQKPDNSSTEYRLIKFCIEYKFDGDVLLYNTLTKHLIALTESELRALKELSTHTDECLKPLIENWFLVPKHFDDCKTADELYSTAKLYEQSDAVTSYTILTTTDCNARCYYCYEHGVTKTAMTEETALDVAKFIIKKSKGKEVSLKWFGGEPLYNLKAIDIICDTLRKNSVAFRSGMVSNAYLFDEAVIEKAKNIWNLKFVQITLDGTEEIYNKTKAYIYKTEKSPFYTVIDNIKNLLKAGIKVDIRLNLSDDNRRNIYELIDYLDKTFIDKDSLKIYAANLYDENRTAAEAERVNNEFFKLDDFLLSKGLKPTKLYTDYKRGCMAQSENAVVISPKGLLGRCEHFSEGELMYGSIYSDTTDLRAKEYWNKFRRIDECYDCPFYPNCFGIGNCPVTSKDCIYSDRPIKLHNISQGVRDIYYAHLKKQKKNGT